LIEGHRAKKPPRTFRVNSIKDVSETVYGQKEDIEKCDFNDLTFRLQPKKKKIAKTNKPQQKKVSFFKLNTGEQAVLKKFVKSRKANSLDLLRELSFDGLTLNRVTILSIFNKLKTQLMAIPKEKRHEISEDNSEAAVLALRLSDFEDLPARIEVLTFKTFFDMLV